MIQISGRAKNCRTDGSTVDADSIGSPRDHRKEQRLEGELSTTSARCRRGNITAAALVARRAGDARRLDAAVVLSQKSLFGFADRMSPLARSIHTIALSMNEGRFASAAAWALISVCLMVESACWAAAFRFLSARSESASCASRMANPRMAVLPDERLFLTKRTRFLICRKFSAALISRRKMAILET